VDTDKLDPVVRSLADAGILSLVSQPPTLEELFLRHYADPGAGVAAPAGSGAPDGSGAPVGSGGSGGAADAAPRKVGA
jgi:ABC-2 type transport system ATP-binding protein